MVFCSTAYDKSKEQSYTSTRVSEKFIAVELGCNIMKETGYFALLETSVILTEHCSVILFYRCTVHFEDSLSITPTNALV